MPSATASTLLMKAITTPARVASLLEASRGRRPLLALEIQRHRIGMAMVWSPLGGEDDVEWLPDLVVETTTSPPSLTGTGTKDEQSHKQKTNRTTNTAGGPSKRRGISPPPAERRRRTRSATSTSSLQEQLTSTILSHDVCGLVVGWPVQKDSGKMGGPCGRVLYTLESMMMMDEVQRNTTPAATRTSSTRSASSRSSRSNSYNSTRTGTAAPCSSLLLSSSHRPLCFWTPPSVLEEAASSGTTEDEWGRCAAYGRKAPMNKTLHLSSREQYAFDENAQAIDLWEDFWKSHWPELYNKRERRDSSSSCCGSSNSNSNNLVADWRDAPAYSAAAQVAI